MNLKKFYKNKRVLITGHTGFKGTWLTQVLLELGSIVYGVSLSKKKFHSIYFDSLNLKNKIEDRRFDICNFDKINNLINKTKPDLIFHLAAQSILSKSINDPYNTFKTNYIGILNLLESLRNINHKCSIVIVTSDKVYENNNWIWGYRENDILGGDDPYSASKSSSEILINSYFKTFLSKKNNINISSARAGNVFGGGDWSADRLIPDILKSYFGKKILRIKNPYSTRPWQFVLEPINGYLKLGLNNYLRKNLNGESFNFGPTNNSHIDVITILKKFRKIYPDLDFSISKNNANLEKHFLSLNSEKAINKLGWTPKLSIDESIKLTSDWYYCFYNNKDINKISKSQIKSFFDL